MVSKKKLIEVALPLDAINAQSAREKSIRHGHPSTLHLWWARRPLATARAVLFGQLVDDPSERADEFRAEAVERRESDVEAFVSMRIEAERERLFDLITRMVDWDNLGDEALFDEVRAEILRSTDGAPPAILDPFAGGGTIPLEAQRLGLEAHASDLNPVAVLINKALIEIPPKFAGRAPVFPDAAGQRTHWSAAAGLAEDVRRYGAWMRDEAERRIGHLYPKARLADGTEANVIAWIWARTVTCPNPACGIEMPLVRSWWLGKKKGKEAYIVPTVTPNGVEYSIGHDPARAPSKENDGTMVGRAGTICVSCRSVTDGNEIKQQGLRGDIGHVLLAIVAEGNRRRIYLDPNFEHSQAEIVDPPRDSPRQELGFDPRNLWTPAYGLTTFDSLFTNRQLVALTTFSDLVGEARERVLQDAVDAGVPEGERLEAGGTGAAAYADAVATYLGLGVSRLSDLNNSLATWSPSRDQPAHLFTRHAVPMAWDFAEVSPFGRAAGDLSIALRSLASVVERLPDGRNVGTAFQMDAATQTFDNLLISTDPPYYDNIGYSDLSDFFYVWLRRSLKQVHPNLLSTLLVPKADELVANPYRHGGRDEARGFFERGFEDVFTRARASASAEYPIAVYYAFKQAEAEIEGTASTGWETILASMIRAGWAITATWPVRSERGGRMISIGTNALASSIVLALRPRPDDAPAIDRRGFTAELRATLPDALRDLQHGSVAPVDLAQAAIGPGMAVFSKYADVLESDGSTMSVRDALRQINAVLDEVVSEQEGDFDADTRWCVSWFEQHGFDAADYGQAETLANAKNASIDGMRRSGALTSSAGRVELLAPAELPADYDPLRDDLVSLWEIVLHLARALDDETGGLDAAGRILARAEARGVDTAAAQQLAYLLYSICEKRGWTAPGVLFNALGASWLEVRTSAQASERAAADAAAGRGVSSTATFEFDGLDDAPTGGF